MDKLRRLSLALVWLALSAPALAQLQTLGPNTPGVTEFEVTLKVGATFLAFPQFTPIHPIQSVGGGWDQFFLSDSGCFEGCGAPPPYGPNTTIPYYVFSMFDVTFKTPVNKVLAQGMTVWDCNLACSGAQMLAFDGQQFVAADSAYGFPTSQGPGCAPPTVDSCTVNLSISAPVITSVWISGIEDLSSTPASIEFGRMPSGVPAPGTFALFVFALAGFALTSKREMG
jgi:hypothetical protein